MSYKYSMHVSLHAVALVAAAAYAYFIFARSTPSDLMYKAGDVLMGCVVVAMLASGRKSLLLVATLAWLVINYLMKLPTGADQWSAYDGFAIATVLSQVALPRVF